MVGKRRKPAARSARTGGLSDLMVADPRDAKKDAQRNAPHPQGAGGIDPAENAGTDEREQTKRRLRRVLR
ncbi:MAG TPA: hypothetical protein VF342_08995 [Alphaproteobacteria bacterium]